METLNGTPPDPARFLKNLRLLVSLLVTTFLQGIITFFVGGMAYFLLLSSYSLFWGEQANVYPLSKLIQIAVRFLLAGGAFALPWLGVWWMLYGLADNGRIRCFFLHLFFAYVPLLVIFLQLDPVYYPDTMIPSSAGEMTFFVCMAMAAVLLYPFYSIGVYYFVLRPAAPPRKIYRFILLCCLFVLISLALLPLLWRMAPHFYPGLADFPSR
ncbi:MULTISPECIES: hypothetical protein [Paenibacillus]|uniref:hypothetical protein n=1 Tax=Paenibacillus TaxID=44249 RepID=UPI00117EB206|nr:hypothetical protein [Paenibacillus borealis]